jgi:hypothetical protein
MKIKTIGRIRTRKVVRDLKVGESGAVIPWGLKYNEAGEAIWIDGNLTVSIPSNGANEVIVKRTGENEYEVDVTNTTYMRCPNE